MQEEQIHAAARILLEARSSRRALRELPATCRPETCRDGYAIQSRLMASSGSAVVGWKVGATSDAAQTLLGTDEPFSGCLLAGRVHAGPADLSQVPLLRALVEAEYVFVLGPLDTHAEPDEGAILRSIKCVRPAIEVCETRFTDLVSPGVPSLIADNAVASHLVIGAPLADWRVLDRVTAGVTMIVNGVVKKQGNGGAVLRDPIRSLQWVIADCLARGERPADDFIVATGSCTGMVGISTGDRIEAQFERLGRVELQV